MNAVQYISRISIETPEKMILARLGYHNHQTDVPMQQMKLIQSIIEEGLLACDPRVAFIIQPFSRIDEQKVMINDKLEINSTSLNALLKKSEFIVIMAGTIGPGIINKIEEEIRLNNGAKAAVIDAVGSEMADAILDWVMKYLNTSLRRENRILTQRRFSPGYGDLGLENQKIIYNILQLNNIGLQLTDTMMLVPEKSVTALAGIEIIQ